MFETAFHTQSDINMEKFSNGKYINPDSSSNTLASFSKIAQSQMRFAAMYERVDDWLSVASGLTSVQVLQEDIDLDGEDEYLLFNSSVFAVFERIGGRMVAAWVRDTATGRAYQTIGNQLASAGTETEEEGGFNVTSNGVLGAYRTSMLKDWWAGTSQYVNDMYSFSLLSNGWTISSSDGNIQKTVTLPSDSGWFEINYNVSGSLNGGTVYIRNGLSPNLFNMLKHGQANLGSETHNNGLMSLANTAPEASVSVMISYGEAGHNTSFSTNAIDDNPGEGQDFATRRMRNQAQTHQVELFGTGSFSFSVGMAATSSGNPDEDGDGMPDAWEDANGLDSSTPNDKYLDKDLDGVSNYDEYMANTNPDDIDDYFDVAQSIQNGSGIIVRFQTRTEREYLIWYADNNLMQPTWYQASSNSIQGTGSLYEWMDDGSETTPHPNQATSRYYKVEVELPTP